jgi:hypothetical protein
VNVREKKGKKKKEKGEKRERGKTREQGHDWFPQIEEVEDEGGGGGQKERAPSIEGSAMSSKVTNPRCVWCEATASFFYVSDCSSILLLRAALQRIRRYPRQASKPEAKRSTRAHKHAQKGSPILSGTQTHSKAS